MHMSSVSVDPAALTTAATGTRSVAADIAAQALTGRVDAAVLAPTFGLIGAEFTAAAVMVIDRHCREVDDLATRMQALGQGLTRAVDTYTGADDTNSAQIAATAR